ncbi:hypothetical protein HanLR1_Chr16g0608861 [Helianthus annuus]|nr:hypothetical protein HanLR1_Chr16g0608861 [Helianthus annuus]
MPDVEEEVYWNLRSFSGALRVTGAKTEPPGSDTGQSEARNAKKQKDKHPSTVADAHLGRRRRFSYIPVA